MDPSHGDSRYNLNYSMSSIGLRLADQVDMYGNPAAVSASAGLLQSMSGGEPSGGPAPCTSGNIMSSAQQCQSMGNSSGNHGKAPQQRGIKRAGSDCYEEAHHSRGLGSGISSIQGLDNFSGSSNAQHSAQQQQQQSQQQHQQSQQQQQQQQPQSGASGVSHVVNDNALQRKKSPPANGKKTKGRVKIKMEYIDNKLRRYTTFSKRKTGIMKKAYELSTLTGTQVMLLVASETGHVYTFATRKLQPMITSEAGKQLIQTCLNSPDPPSVGGGDQRMSATGFEETELSYNIADEDSKEPRSPLSSMNDSEDSSDLEGVGVINNSAEMSLIDNNLETENKLFKNKNDPVSITAVKNIQQDALQQNNDKTTNTTKVNVSNKNVSNHPTSNLSNVPQEMLLQLIEAGHLQVHTEEDGSGHQYVAIPLHPSTVDMLHSKKSPTHATLAHPVAETIKNTINLTTQTYLSSQNQTTPAMIIKQEISE